MGHYAKYKVAILGFGVEGQDAARYFLGQGSTVTIFDQKEKEVVLTPEWKDKPLSWVCGPDYLKEGLKEFDYIVRSPGVYRYKPEIVEAEKKGSKITSTTKLFFIESEANIIGITGTKGKGTVARMLQNALEKAGFSTLLLGNIGAPMLDRIPDADTFKWVIVELSSFQAIDVDQPPQIAVVTNITTDHLNWHKDREEYIHAKENLWKNQTKTQKVVFNRDDETCRELAANAPGDIYWFSLEEETVKGAYAKNGRIYVNGKEVEEAGDLKVPGLHNLADALAALAAAVLAGADPRSAWDGISEFEGYEHRLERVGRIGDTLYINDSASTSPEAAVAALKAYGQPKILIAGGSLKGVPFGNFAENIKEQNVRAVFLIGESAGVLKKELEKIGYPGEIITGIEDMDKLVKKTRGMANPGDVVMLSPACASFGIFKDYKDRGEQFKKAVLDLKDTA